MIVVSVLISAFHDIAVINYEYAIIKDDKITKSKGKEISKPPLKKYDLNVLVIHSY